MTKGRSMKINRQLAASALALAMMTVAGCSAESGGGSDELLVLFSAPLSGDSAESGRAMLNGAELAARDINDAGGISGGVNDGKMIRIEAADDEMASQAANSIASKYVSEEKYFALAGFLDTGLAQAASVVASRNDLSLVSTFGCGDSLTSSADNVFVMCASPESNGRVAAAFVADEIPGAKIATISIDVPQLDFYFNGLDAVAKDRDLDLVKREIYPPTATDYATTVTNALSGSPDAIISGSLQASAAQILNQVRRTDQDVIYVDMLGEGWSSTFLDIAGENAIGAFTQDLGLGLEGAGDQADVSAAYFTEYDTVMNAAAQHGYDSIMAIAEAAKAGATRATLADTLVEVSFDGVTGPISFADGKRADKRVITISEVTGIGPDDRTVLARYIVGSDGSVDSY